MNTSMKTSELIGPALDWAVAKCEGLDPRIVSKKLPNERFSRRIFVDGAFDASIECNFTFAWAQGGPIIERAHLQITYQINGVYKGDWSCTKWADGVPTKHYGRTPLIAAMRCYVASKLGDDIEIPIELTQMGEPT